MGGTLRPASDDTAQATARAVGYVSGLGVAMDLEPEVMAAAPDAATVRRFIQTGVIQ